MVGRRRGSGAPDGAARTFGIDKISGGIAVGAILALAAPASAQTDFYNLDKERPLRVEDAYATKRYAFEAQLSPFTLAQQRDGRLQYTPVIELKYGLLPGMEVSAGTNFAATRGGVEPAVAGNELEFSGLVNLTVETPTMPALALRLTGHVPIGSGDHGSYLEVRGIGTRSLFGPVRAHVNGAGIVGGDAPERWWAGLALDYVLPFQHTLLLAETYVATPPSGSRLVQSTAGVRYQISPTLALDGGVGRSWTGERSQAQDWFMTLGFTYEFGVRALMPVRGPGR
jgi:hypothetical protein